MARNRERYTAADRSYSDPGVALSYAMNQALFHGTDCAVVDTDTNAIAYRVERLADGSGTILIHDQRRKGAPRSVELDPSAPLTLV